MGNEWKISEVISCDVLILGAGGAGLRCAAEILEKRLGCKVIAVTKVSHPQKSHTSTAQGGLAAVDPKDPVDKPIYHMFDTWKGSDCMADQNVVKRIVEAGWEEILWLENRGMHFSRDVDGKLARRTFGGHTLNFGETSAYRAVFEADRTGKGIMDTLWGEVIKRGISFIHQSMATELLFNGDRCVGAVVFSPKSGKFTAIRAKATVLAMGGCGQVFKITTNCRQNTGDHLALAVETGLPVMDPEAVQFHPTGIVGPGILASETLRSVGGILRNKDLEAFMERYAPKMKELAPRDLVARAIETEIREGRGILNPSHGIEHVWIDLRHLPEHVHKTQIPEVASFFKKFVNVDTRTELCPIRPSNHYHMGGIPTNEDGQVLKGPNDRVPGLFAIGECACASFHGFNRLGTNSLLELITMGRFAAQKAMEDLDQELPPLPPDAGSRTFEKFSSYFAGRSKVTVGSLRERMKAVMTEKVGVFRNEQGIKEAISLLEELKEEAQKCGLRSRDLLMNQELVERWELDNLLTSAMLIAQGALHRRESRGGHFREDFPERRSEFDRHTLVYMEQFGKVRIDWKPVDMTLYEEGSPYAEKFGMIERKY
jgi:succinate dehydrogenase / fumarate reductase flavoprotein subunit